MRYFGVFSNHHALRSLLLPAGASATADTPTQVPLFDTAGLHPWQPSTSQLNTGASPAKARIGWAKLLALVFAIDVTVCRRCGGPVRIISAITDADQIARLLHSARPPPRPHPAGQLGFFDP